jgi:tRNA A-37 threonylcarbamoyl transferase component Bud32
MNAKTPWINVVNQKFKDYLEKVSLKEEARAKVGQVVNELHFIALIHSSLAEDSRALLDSKLEEVSRVLEEKIKGQGWMSYFTKSSEVVTLEEVWKCIHHLTDEPRQHLIEDICTLKGYREAKAAQ